MLILILTLLKLTPCQILGRSTELNAFVKHSRDKGYIEIELKGKIGAPNLVIRRNINSTNRQSNFTLNGTIVPGREINERLAELNVQVGNLWCVTREVVTSLHG
jgi:hypothetical protein